MDRKGAFIPGVNFVGSSKNQVDFITNTVLGLDGNPLIMTVEAQIDTIAGDSLQEVYLVDKKSFAKADYSDKPKDITVPSTEGAAYNPSQMLTWIERLRSGDLGNVYYKRFSEEGGFTYTTGTGGNFHYELTASVPLWELPPDGFEPCLVAVTANNAVSTYHFDYSGEKEKEQLVGIRLEGDNAKVLNNITLMANAQAAGGSYVNQLMDIVSPTGSLIPMPQFEAGVTEEEDGYLTYEYKLGIKLLQGKKDVSGSDSAFMSIAPTTLGIAVYGELGMTLNGEERELTDSYNVTVAAELFSVIP